MGAAKEGERTGEEMKRRKRGHGSGGRGLLLLQQPLGMRSPLHPRRKETVDLIFSTIGSKQSETLSPFDTILEQKQFEEERDVFTTWVIYYLIILLLLLLDYSPCP